MTQSPKVDLEVVARSLYEAPGVLTRIVRDYGFVSRPDSPVELARALWSEFGQTPVDDPHVQRPTNAVVFRAAVRAIGSNSRAWATYLKNEPELEGLLLGFDPSAVSAAVSSRQLNAGALKALLPGQSSSGDARAIVKWAERLSGTGQFHDELRSVATCFEDLAQQDLPGGFQQGELFLCVVGFFGYPPNRWLKKANLPDEWRSRSAEQWKLPGMGYALTSEMLRNLRWDGYKVDRHIMRLLARWAPDLVEASRGRALELAELVGSTNRELLDVLAYSLAGMKLAPEDVPRSHVDNLIWALGAYVEKKGHESGVRYLV